MTDNYRVAAVGAKTADRLLQFGHTASFLPSDSYGELLFTEFIDGFGREGDVVIFPRNHLFCIADA